jgi:hypothetical protein
MNLSEATTQLGPYIRDDATSQINLAIERILAFGKFKGLTKVIELPVYDDGVLTLPQNFETLLGVCHAGRSHQPRDHWFRFASGHSFCADPNYYCMDLGDGFTTYRDIEGTAVVTATESFGFTARWLNGIENVAAAYDFEIGPTGNMVVSGAGTAAVNGVYLRDGELNGKPLFIRQNAPDPEEMQYHVRWDAGNWIVGSESYFSTQDVATPDLVTEWTVDGGEAPAPTVTAEMALNSPITLGPVTRITRFQKPRTQTPVYVEINGTRVAEYAPEDTLISYRRYSIPNAKSGDTLLALCKARYRPVSDPDDLLPVDSIYSLRLALEALSYESAGDLDKAANYWGLCRKSLDDALSEHRNASGRTLPIYVRAAAGKGLRAIR